MPHRPTDQSVESLFKEVLERLRAAERIRSDVQELLDHDTRLSAYSWQSTFSLVTGFGHKLYADRNGTIAYIRAERSSADGTTTATFDVLRNGTSLFDATHPSPSVPTGKGIGLEQTPNLSRFTRGDWFQVNVTATGGGTGPLRVTIHFQSDQTPFDSVRNDPFLTP